LLVIFTLVQDGDIPAVKAFSSIYQGDLILTGNTVYRIEDERFEINGSIIVEDNATLVLNNATLKFVHTDSYHHRMFFGKLMVGGTPRLQAINSTITSDSDYPRIPISFIGDSSITASNLNVSKAWIDVGELTSGTFSDCNIELMEINNNYHYVAVLDSKIELLSAGSASNVSISNSILETISISTEMANFSLIGFKPGFFDFWNFRLNCSVEILIAPWGRAANVTLTNTQIDSFRFSGYHSGVIAVNSTVEELWVSEPAHEWGPHATAHVVDCSISELHAWDSSCVWLTNSTFDTYDVQHSAKIYVYRYLDVYVTDLESSDVNLANVTIKYPNGTMFNSELTDVAGYASFTLMEKMINCTGNYPIGNYTVTAKYETYEGQQSINMTGNQEIILQLPFIIPEFPSFIILPLFMIATLLAVIVYKRKHSA
jgi:hypothetical protein